MRYSKLLPEILATRDAVIQSRDIFEVEVTTVAGEIVIRE